MSTEVPISLNQENFCVLVVRPLSLSTSTDSHCRRSVVERFSSAINYSRP